MEQQPQPNDPRYIDYLVRLAAKTAGTGIIEEPRVFYDVVTLNDSDPLLTPFVNNVFQNGEQFPVRLTHLVIAPRPDFTGQDPGLFSDERLIQQVALRLRFHDTDYQNEVLVPAPLWANKLTSSPDTVSLGSAHWIPDRPLILSARDSLQVQIQAEPQTFLGTRDAGVAATGVGLLSRRPYFFAASTQLDQSDVPVQLDPNLFKNDGTEPVAITDFTFFCGSDSEASSAAGDIRRARFQVQQIGNGTQTPLFKGPTTTALPRFCPGQLLGISGGRAAVHRFPGAGVLWEPGDGVTAVAASTDAAETGGMQLLVAFVGYITLR